VPLSITINYKPLRNHLNHYKPIIFHYNLLTTTIHHLFTTQKNRLRPGETGGWSLGARTAHGGVRPLRNGARCSAKRFLGVFWRRFGWKKPVQTREKGWEKPWRWWKTMEKNMKMVENNEQNYENGGKQWKTQWTWWKVDGKNSENMVIAGSSVMDRQQT